MSNGSRLHDCMYDLVYTVSSPKDYEHDLYRLQRAAINNKSIPPYKTMFSDNSHYSTVLRQEQAKDNKYFRISEKIIQGPIGSIKVAEISNAINKTKNISISTKELLGRYRARYFASPVGTSSSSNDSLEPLFTNNNNNFDGKINKIEFRPQIIPPTPPSQTRGTQTDYRDSEAQTDPYSPPFVVRPGTDPEILLLKDLKWGHGLPAGRLEVEMIQKARERRAGKISLERIRRDDKEMKKWQKLLQTTDLPLETFLYEEQRQEYFRDNRLELLAKSLQDLREKHGDLIQERLRALWKRRHREKEQKMSKIQTNKTREFRKLQLKKTGVASDIDPSIEVMSLTENAIATTSNNKIHEEALKTNVKQRAYSKPNSQVSSFKTSRPLTLNDYSHYKTSDVSDLSGVLPHVILSTKESDIPYIDQSAVSFTRSGRRNKLERDLEEAYLKILEKKTLSNSALPLLKNGRQYISVTKRGHVPQLEDAETQTESADIKVCQNDKMTKMQNNVESSSEEELNEVLEQLLKEHWEAIDLYFHSLLMIKENAEEKNRHVE